MPTFGELYCFICDSNMTVPTVDNWESFKKVITVWVDCWWWGKVPTFRVENDTLTATVDDVDTVKVRYTLEGPHTNEFPLQVLVYDEDDNEWNGDWTNPPMTDGL